eukprot:INCI9207.4.p1 GENE.INCI9207.4~~INCI9207.4.p1  ORF type:complete len:364 (+),score=101.94 INCI9207.4:114-1205(+)
MRLGLPGAQSERVQSLQDLHLESDTVAALLEGDNENADNRASESTKYPKPSAAVRLAAAKSGNARKPRNTAMLAQRVLEQNETISELKAVVSTKDASLAELRRKLEGLEEAVSMSTQPQKFVADILRQKSETIDALERQLNRARAESSDAARALQEAREENVACQKDMHELLAQRKGFEERFKAAIAEARLEIEHFRGIAQAEIVRREKAEKQQHRRQQLVQNEKQRNPGSEDPRSSEQLELLRSIKQQVQQQQQQQQQQQTRGRKGEAGTPDEDGENEAPAKNRGLATLPLARAKEANMQQHPVRPFPPQQVQAVPDEAAPGGGAASTDGSSVLRMSFVRQRVAKDGHALPAWYRRMRVQKT